jgi:putative transposase
MWVMGIRNFEFSENEFYHVYNRGTEKRKIFMGKGDYERFVYLLYTANSDTPVHLSNYQGYSLMEIPRGETIVDIGAWCLMPNHIHLLLREKQAGGISIFMKKLLTGYSMYFNTKNQRKGALFEGTYKAKHLDYDQYLKYEFTYVHLNPISIIDSGWKEKHIEDKKKAKEFLDIYKYSSYLDYSGGDRPEAKILNKEAFPEYFETSADFQEMVEEWVNFDKNIKDTP